METLSNRSRSRSEFAKSSNGETEQEQHEQGGKMVSVTENKMFQ
jgi:hypothetical protein